MNYRPEDFSHRRLNAAEETALAKQLRSVDPVDRHVFVRRLLEVNLHVGLKMMRCTVTDRTELRSLFDSRLSDLDAGVGQIGAWIQSFLPKIGFRTVVAILRKRIDDDPMAVGRALYCLKPLIPKNQYSRCIAEELWGIAQKRGAILGPIIVPDPNRPGQFLFRPIPHEYKKPPPATA